MKQRIFLLTLLFLLILTRTNDISAKETKLNEDMFTNVENTLKDKEIDLSYTQLVKQLIHGNVKRCSAYDQSQNERGLFKPYVDPKRPDQRNPSDRIYRSHL